MAFENSYETDGYDPFHQPPTDFGGYRPAPWASNYDPGPNWNGGVAPAPPDGRYDYNGGSPVDAPLTAGHGWEWEGPQAPQWNTSTNQWDRGVWQQREGRGIGYQAPTNTAGGGGGGSVAPSGSGAVAPISGGGGVPSISVPSSSLPSDITSLFNQTPTKTPVQSAYQDALLSFMGRSQIAPTLDDSILGPQSEVYRAASQRGMERNRKVAAERAAATGRNQSGYLDRQINSGAQEQAFNTASFNANLLGKEANSRREELLAALQLARATGDAESERELRARLAQVSASMQQQGLNLQGQLGAGDLALRQLMAKMGNEQFYDQLGTNTALNMEQLNQSAFDRVMRGM